MFKDWSDEKLLQEVEEGFRDYADVKVKDNVDLISYYREQIKLKEREINRIEWEMGVAIKDAEEWKEVLDRIDLLTVEEEVPVEPEQTVNEEEIIGEDTGSGEGGL